MEFMSKTAQVNPTFAELQALRQGLLMAVEHNLTPIDINSDSLDVVNMFHNENLLYSNLIFE